MARYAPRDTGGRSSSTAALRPVKLSSGDRGPALASLRRGKLVALPRCDLWVERCSLPLNTEPATGLIRTHLFHHSSNPLIKASPGGTLICTSIRGYPMNATPSAAHSSAPLSLDANTLPDLTAQRDHFQNLKQEARREWYEQQLLRHSPERLEHAVAERAQTLFSNIIARLHTAASAGNSSVIYHAIFRHESVGWNFAQVSDDGLLSGPLDLSMLPFDHTVRIQATERVAAALAEGGLKCEVRRVPAGSENCLLEELSLKVSIP